MNSNVDTPLKRARQFPYVKYQKPTDVISASLTQRFLYHNAALLYVKENFSSGT